MPISRIFIWGGCSILKRKDSFLHKKNINLLVLSKGLKKEFLKDFIREIYKGKFF